MKKIVGVLVVLFVILGVRMQTYAIDWMLPGGQYLVEDDMLSANNTAANNGWDSHEAGGDIGAEWGSGTWFEDNSVYTDVDMTRKISETKTGRVSLEYLYWFEDNIDGFKWMVKNGETPVITIKTKGTSLYAVKPDGSEIRLADYKVISESDKTKVTNAKGSVPYTLGTGVRIDMDLDAKIYSIYINGKLCGENIPMADNVINNIQFISTKEETGKLYITAVRCYRNYWANETHISSTVGKDLPATFKAVTDGGTITVEQMNSQLWMDVSNLRFKSNGNGQDLSYSRDLNVTDDLVAFEYMVIDTEKKGGFKASFGDGIEITMDNDTFAFNGTPFYTNYYKNLWYNVKVIADYSKGLCDVYLNNIKRLENAPLKGTSKNSVRFEALPEADINIGLDDIRVYPMISEPEDYVSEPRRVDSPLEVGMWSCSLWRTGKHQLGWDKIKPWSERESVLGFYDEGNPEVNDWETKYMTEHGVDFQMFCWFKPDGSYANPIKEPNWSYALEDGLKMSKYKDMQKYTFTFENLTASITSPEMFKEFVVPYWIEYYFKDPNFYRYNNKPVVNIYHVQYFIEQLSGGRGSGVTEKSIVVAKETLQWFEEECKRQGFDGVELWTAAVTDSNGIGTVGFDVLKELGFDCGCPYGYDAEQGANLSYLQSTLLRGKENNFDVVGLVSTGMDSEPCSGKKGIMTDIETFDDMCAWIADEYTLKLAEGEHGKNVVMIDNWNEIGEGHYVHPMKSGYGWTRMDSIRRHFCNESEADVHEHEVPTENQQSRIQVLYDQTRKGYLTSSGTGSEKYPTKVVKGWYFNTGFDGWSFNSTSEVKNEDGAIHLKATQPIGSKMYINNLDINADDITYIKLRLKFSRETAKKTEIFFKNGSMQEYVWNYNFKTIVDNGDFQDIYIKTSVNKFWTGEMTALYYDVFSGYGEAWIDSIELLGDYEDPSGLIVFNNEIVPIGVERINGTAMLNIAETIKYLKEDSKFDWTTKGFDNLKFAVGGKIYEVKAGNKTYSINNEKYEIGKEFVMYEDNLHAPIDFFLIPLGVNKAKYNETENSVYFSSDSPETIKVVPADSSRKVTQYEKPIITFDSPMKPGSISNIELKNGGKTVEAEKVISKDGFSVTILPKAKLAPNTEYTISVPATVVNTLNSPVKAAEFNFTTGDTNMILDYDFDNATDDNLEIIYGTGEWEASYSVGSLNGSNALKIILPSSYNWAMIKLPTSMNADMSRKFIVSFDMSTATDDRKWTDVYWYHKYNTEEKLTRYDSYQRKQHYEFLVDSASEWDAGLKFANPNGVNSNVILIDNLKIEYLDEIRVISSSPANDQTDVATSSPVIINFNKTVTNTGNIKLVDLTDKENPEPVKCNVTASTDELGRTIVTLNHSGLNDNTRYVVDFKDVTDDDGQNIFFTTGNALFIYGFEDELNGDNGIANGVDSSWAINWRRTTEAATNGSYSLKVDTDTSVAETGGNMYFKIPNMDNMQYSQNTYKMKIDIKDALPNGASTVSFIIAYYTDGGIRHYDWLITRYNVTEDFKTIEKTFVIDESANIYGPSVYMLCEGEASFYIDNFIIEKIKPVLTLYGDGAELTQGKLVAENSVVVEYTNIPRNSSYLGIMTICRDGALVDVGFANPTIEGGENNKITLSLPKDKEGCEVKAFLWNGLDTLMPVVECVSVN